MLSLHFTLLVWLLLLMTQVVVATMGSDYDNGHKYTLSLEQQLSRILERSLNVKTDEGQERRINEKSKAKKSSSKSTKRSKTKKSKKKKGKDDKDLIFTRTSCGAPLNNYRTCYDRVIDPSNDLTCDAIRLDNPFTSPYIGEDEELVSGKMHLTLTQYSITAVTCEDTIAMEEISLEYLKVSRFDSLTCTLLIYCRSSFRYNTALNNLAA